MLNRKMIIDNRAKEDYSKYKFFKRFDKPIRVVYDYHNRPSGADILDIETGELTRNATLISLALDDAYSDEISEEEFYELCEQIMKEDKDGKTK